MCVIVCERDRVCMYVFMIVCMTVGVSERVYVCVYDCVRTMNK